jgi:SAM-dependent methyltransferase
MDRLGFKLPNFTRISWVSDTARSTWEPRLRRVAEVWLDIQWLAILSGIRRCSLALVPPWYFATRAEKWSERDLDALLVGVEISIHGSFGTSLINEKANGFALQVVVGRKQDVDEFKALLDMGDQQAIGARLGLPSCCTRFDQERQRQGFLDTIWRMSVASVPNYSGDFEIEVAGSNETNIFWQPVGICAVPHLPCRVDCASTIQLGKDLINIGKGAGYVDEMNWLSEILSWPVEWSALHGIAEVKTPVLKISTRTDATARKYTVRRKGASYPPEGGQGLKFPYRMMHTPYLTASRGFQRGLDNPVRILSQHKDTHASDNGFSSSLTMDIAHEPILELVEKILTDHDSNVLDLGCGSGALLKKIHEAHPQAVLFGVDIDPAKIKRAQALNSQFAENFTPGDMFENDLIWPEDRRYAVALVMPGRLLEADAAQAAKLKLKLKHHCDRILVYAYEDWLVKYGNLQKLADEAGMLLSDFDATVKVSLAVIP